MTIITCPQCAARIKIARPPATVARLQCPQCRQTVKLSPHVQAGSPPLASANGAGRLHRVQASGGQRGLAVGIIAAAILLAAGGIITAILISNSAPEKPADQPPPPVASAKEKPKDTDNAMEREREAAERARREKEEYDREVARKQAEAERIEKEKQEKEREQHRREFTQLMIDGGTALNTKKYDDAIAAYTAALKLFPDDTGATQKLSDARAAKAASVATTENDEKKRKEDLAKYLRMGDDEMMKKNYAAAVALYQLAVDLAKDDAAPARALNDARAALAKDQDEQKKAAQFEALLTSGRAALKAGDAAGALREFNAAQRIFPFSPVVGQLIDQANAMLVAAKNPKDPPKGGKDKDKGPDPADYQRLLNM